MPRKLDSFSIWLGITILGIVMLVFFVLVKYRADFFHDITLTF